MKLQSLLQEVLTWVHLKHIYVLPFLGLDQQSFEGYPPCIVTPYMRNGTMKDFVKNRRGTLTDRQVDQLLFETAQGLAYLHSQNIVHGDLRGENTLIDSAEHVQLADFGLAVVTDATIGTTSTTQHGSSRWMAPELLNPELEFKRTRASDVYAFACLCVEIYTGKQPFWNVIRDITVVFQILEQKRPPRPSSLGPPNGTRSMSDQLWAIVEACWAHKPSDRPDMHKVSELLDHNTRAGLDITLNETDCAVSHHNRFSVGFTSLIEFTGIWDPDDFCQHCDLNAEVLVVIESLRNLSICVSILKPPIRHQNPCQINRLSSAELQAAKPSPFRSFRRCISILKPLIRHRNPRQEIPSRVVLKAVTRASRSFRFADIFLGKCKGQDVALKRLQVYRPEPNEILKFSKEVLTWVRLEHIYVLPFLGLDKQSFEGYPPCIITPYMRNGTLTEFVKNRRGTFTDRRVDQLLFETAQGLAYLHSQNIIHGDLRGENVLIDSGEHAQLADFGLAVVTDATIGTTKTTQRGSLRWMAPELLKPEVEFKRTRASDVYAFACLCVEIYTGEHPFWNLHDVTVLLQVVEQKRPPRPSSLGPPDGTRAMSDDLWAIVEACWEHKPSDRPDMDEVLELIMA
ncbi:kinase-like domain-containing protein [Mycena rebaudengoi]|nr:kinase-like domain-containing protein [Mycena rebaudengoi]